MLRSAGLPTDNDVCAVPKPGTDKKKMWTDEDYLQINDLNQIFIVTAVGLTVSLMVFLLEVYYEKRNPRKSNVDLPIISIMVDCID